MASHIEIALAEAMCANVPTGALLWDYTRTTAVAMREPGSTMHHDWVVVAEDQNYEARCFGGEEAERPVFHSLYAQVKIESYRVDLVLHVGCALIFIECDGHDWHERTKQQAAYDRERDRFFLAQGLPTVRFTGSEIVNYPEKCCRDLYAVANTFDRIGTALVRNGFNNDGTSFREIPSTGLANRSDGTSFQAHWNPGRAGRPTPG